MGLTPYGEALDMRSFEFIRCLLVSCPELKDQSVPALFELDGGALSPINYVGLEECEGEQVILMGFEGRRKGLTVRQVMLALKRLKAPSAEVCIAEFSREAGAFEAEVIEGCLRYAGSLQVIKSLGD